MYSVNEIAFAVDVHRIKGFYSISDHRLYMLADSHKFVVLRGGGLASKPKAKVAEDILRVTSARNLCKCCLLLTTMNAQICD
jgi:hypothetical protein